LKLELELQIKFSLNLFEMETTIWFKPHIWAQTRSLNLSLSPYFLSSWVIFSAINNLAMVF
jgi:hypothetical protein